jgi:hypothetical protein
MAGAKEPAAEDSQADRVCRSRGDTEIDPAPFPLRKLSIHDKHGRTRNAFNAKVNIYRRDATPILLGIEDKLLCDDERYGVTRGHVVKDGL